MKNKVLSINSKLSHLGAAVPTVDWGQVLNDWLNTKASAHTRRVYRSDVGNFLEDTGQTLGSFITLDRTGAFEVVSRYRGQLVAQGLTPATINRRLSAVKSLVAYAYKSGYCDYELSRMVGGVKARPYRDTTGVNREQFKSILAQCDLSTILGKRDYAILCLLWSNALRRGELNRLNRTDFDRENSRLRITGKGRSESEWVTLSDATREAIGHYLSLRDDSFAGLFISHDRVYYGHTLSTESIAKIVKKYSQRAGITKPMSPHRIRHSSITAALDATDGNVRAVQKLSRHSNLNTLILYDDNRVNQQGEVSNLLSNLLS